MINTEVRVIKLSCVSCGSSLDISQSMNRLACGHCGTQQMVERSGGAIHLRGVAEALFKVQVGTDKTAAELAINRISKELEAAYYQRAEREQYWLSIRTQKLYEWNTFLAGRKKTVSTITIITLIVCLIPFGIAARANSEIVYFICLIAAIVGTVLVRNAMNKTGKYNPRKLQDDCNKELADLDRQIAGDLGEADKYITALNAKIQQNYQIANS